MPSSSLALTICLFATTVSAQTQQSAERQLNLSALKQSPARCEHGIESQLLDNTRILISNPICVRRGVDSAYQIAIMSLDGAISASIDLDDNSRYPYVGPIGYIFIPSGGTGWLIYDDHLHRLGSVPAHTGESEGTIVLSPSRTAVALVFPSGDGYSYPWRYVVLAGQPLESRGIYTIPDGYPHISDSGSVDNSVGMKIRFYEFSGGEIWYFDEGNNHRLSRRSSTGNISVLPDADWLSPRWTEIWCSAQLSAAIPHRLLANCTGDTSIGFGRASVFRNHNRFIVYDARGTPLLKKDISGDSSVSLSPDGRLIAISHARSIQLEQLP